MMLNVLYFAISTVQLILRYLFSITTFNDISVEVIHSWSHSLLPLNLLFKLMARYSAMAGLFGRMTLSILKSRSTCSSVWVVWVEWIPPLQVFPWHPSFIRRLLIKVLIVLGNQKFFNSVDSDCRAATLPSSTTGIIPWFQKLWGFGTNQQIHLSIKMANFSILSRWGHLLRSYWVVLLSLVTGVLF